MTNVVWLVLALVVIVGVNVWAAGMDKQRAMSISLYEDCVQKEYHMTPLKYYEDNKMYPHCGN